MSKRILSSALVGLAASLSLATVVHATTLTFDDINFSPGSYDSHQNDFFYGGFHFTDEQMVVMPPPHMGSNPRGVTTQFMEFGSQVDVNDVLVMTRADGGAFDFLSIKLALGDGNLTEDFDNLKITGQKAANCQQNCDNPTAANFAVSYDVASFFMEGFTGLSSVTFGLQTRHPDGSPRDIGWLAMDDLSFRESSGTGAGGAAPAPEPSAWALMIVGFGGIGAALRRRGRVDVPQTA